MSKIRSLQTQWGMGMRRDMPRNNIPASALWDAIDVIVNYDAPIRQRGGWVHHSQAVSAVTASAASIRAGCYATFSTSVGGATTRNIAVDEDGFVFDVTTADAASAVGAGVTMIQNPVFHGGAAASAATIVYTGLMLFPDGTGAAAPKKYNGTTLSTLGGTPPKAKYCTVYKDYTVLANGVVGSTSYSNRVWFSPEGDPDCAVSVATVWDTTDSWIDFSYPVVALGTTRNAMLVFHTASVSRVRGSVPPPDEDMIVDDSLFSVGILDAMSLAEHRDTVIWASADGVFRTDGVVLDNLTRRGGMARYWQDLTRTSTSSWTFAGGILGDHYFLCVMDGATLKDMFLIDLVSLSWTRLSNIDAATFWSGQNGVADELYWGRRNAPRASRLATIFQVGESTLKTDGDGDNVVCSIETPFYDLGRTQGLKRIRRVYTGYELSDYSTDNPSVAVSFTTTPDSTSYTSTATLTENSTFKTSRVDINRSAPGLGLKFVKSGAGDFSLWNIGVDSWELDDSRLAQ